MLDTEAYIVIPPEEANGKMCVRVVFLSLWFVPWSLLLLICTILSIMLFVPNYITICDTYWGV